MMTETQIETSKQTSQEIESKSVEQNADKIEMNQNGLSNNPNNNSDNHNQNQTDRINENAYGLIQSSQAASLQTANHRNLEQQMELANLNAAKITIQEQNFEETRNENDLQSQTVPQTHRRKMVVRRRRVVKKKQVEEKEWDDRFAVTDSAKNKKVHSFYREYFDKKPKEFATAFRLRYANSSNDLPGITQVNTKDNIKTKQFIRAFKKEPHENVRKLIEETRMPIKKGQSKAFPVPKEHFRLTQGWCNEFTVMQSRANEQCYKSQREFFDRPVTAVSRGNSVSITSQLKPMEVYHKITPVRSIQQSINLIRALKNEQKECLEKAKPKNVSASQSVCSDTYGMIPNLRQHSEKKIYMPIREKLAKRNNGEGKGGASRKNMRQSATQGDFYKSVIPGGTQSEFDLKSSQNQALQHQTMAASQDNFLAPSKQLLDTASHQPSNISLAPTQDGQGEPLVGESRQQNHRMVQNFSATACPQTFATLQPQGNHINNIDGDRTTTSLSNGKGNNLAAGGTLLVDQQQMVIPKRKIRSKRKKRRGQKSRVMSISQGGRGLDDQRGVQGETNNTMYNQQQQQPVQRLQNMSPLMEMAGESSAVNMRESVRPPLLNQDSQQSTNFIALDDKTAQENKTATGLSPPLANGSASQESKVDTK